MNRPTEPAGEPDFSHDERQGWRTAQQLSKTLNTRSKALRSLGVELVRGKSGSRWIELSKDNNGPLNQG